MCVLTQSPVRATHEEPALIDCSRHMLAEAEAMALAMGYRLDIDAERVVATNTQLAHRPSILQDLEAGRPMESRRDSTRCRGWRTMARADGS